MKADLADVPKDKVIITCSYHNPFKTPNTSPHGSHNAYSLNYKGTKTSHGAPNIQCISVARWQNNIVSCLSYVRVSQE